MRILLQPDVVKCKQITAVSDSPRVNTIATCKGREVNFFRVFHPFCTRNRPELHAIHAHIKRRRRQQFLTNSSDFRTIHETCLEVDDSNNVTDDVRWFAASRRAFAAVPLRLSAAVGRRSHNGVGRSGFSGGGGSAKETAAKAAAEAWRGRRGGAGKVLLETVHDGVRDGLRGARQTRRRPTVSEVLRPVNKIIRVQYNNIISRYKLYVIVL